jgi:hypothetical protein
MAKHPSKCEEAVHNKCVCQACGGALHRWSWCLKAATESSGELRDQRRRELDSAWVKAQEKDAVASKAEVAVNTGVIDVVDWLAEDFQATPNVNEDNSTVSYLKAGLTHLVGDKARSEIDQLVGGPGPSSKPNPTRIALADHFWCDLFAAIARAIADLNADLDKIPQEATKLIIASRADRNNLVKPKRADKPRSKSRKDLEDKIIELAVKSVFKAAWKPVQAVYGAKLGLLARHARILAILICPAPEHHRAVMEDCMKPMFNQEIRKPTVDQIKESLYQDLFTASTEGMADASQA